LGIKSGRWLEANGPTSCARPEKPAHLPRPAAAKQLRQGEALVLRSARGRVRVRFSAAKLHLVAAAPQPKTLRVTVDEGTPQAVEVERPTLYTLFDSSNYVEHGLVIEAEIPGLSLFSATFG
jgi:hypothetical protein